MRPGRGEATAGARLCPRLFWRASSRRRRVPPPPEPRTTWAGPLLLRLLLRLLMQIAPLSLALGLFVNYRNRQEKKDGVLLHAAPRVVASESRTKAMDTQVPPPFPPPPPPSPRPVAAARRRCSPPRLQPGSSPPVRAPFPLSPSSVNPRHHTTSPKVRKAAPHSLLLFRSPYPSLPQPFNLALPRRPSPACCCRR